MRILQIVSGVEVNGAFMHCLLLSRELAKRGHQITVMCRRRSWIWPQLEHIGIQRVACEMSRNRADLSFARDYVRENEIELIHTHMSRAHMFGILLRWLTRTPCVATAHSCKLQLHWRLNDFVIANSQDTYRFQTRFNRVRENQIKTVYYFSDLTRFAKVSSETTKKVRTELGLGDDDFLLGIVGDVLRRKGHDLLFKELPQLCRKHPQLKTVVVGRYDEKTPFVRKLRDESSRAGLKNRIIWTGCTDDVPKFMAALDLCIVPSRAEPLGLVVMEAMAARVPVAAAKIGGLQESISHRENGFLFESSNSTSLGNAVDALIHDPDMRNRLAKNGHESVFKKFSPAVLTTQIEQVLQHVLDSNFRPTKQAA